jgi:hypothetical protein
MFSRAISPEGRQANIGEVLVGDSRRNKLDVTNRPAGRRQLPFTWSTLTGVFVDFCGLARYTQ